MLNLYIILIIIILLSASVVIPYLKNEKVYEEKKFRIYYNIVSVTGIGFSLFAMGIVLGLY